MLLKKSSSVSIAKLNILEPFLIFIAALYVLIQLKFCFLFLVQITDFMLNMVKIP